MPQVPANTQATANTLNTLNIDQLLPEIRERNLKHDPDPTDDLGWVGFDCPVCSEGVDVNYTRQSGTVTDISCACGKPHDILNQLNLPIPGNIEQEVWSLFDDDEEETPSTPGADPDDVTIEEMRESWEDVSRDERRLVAAAEGDKEALGMSYGHAERWLAEKLAHEMWRANNGKPVHQGVVDFYKDIIEENTAKKLAQQAARFDSKAGEKVLVTLEQAQGKPLATCIAPPFTGTSKPINWLVPDWLERGNVTLLAGKGGVGKSRIALQLAVQLAIGGGRAVFGDTAPLFRTARHGKTLYMSWEDDGNEYHRRLQSFINPGENPDAATKATMALVNDNIDFVDLRERGPLWAPWKGGSQHLTTKGEQTPLFDQVQEYAAETQPELIVVDTVAAAYLGDENARPLVRAFVTALSVWANQSGAAVMLITHPSKSSDVSGSTDWENGVRTVWNLQRHEDGLLLMHRKANHAPIQEDIYLAGQQYPYYAAEMPVKRTETALVGVKMCKGYSGFTCDIEIEGNAHRCPPCKEKHDQWRKSGGNKA